MVHKVHSFIDYGGEFHFEMNDLIILNVYHIKYIEMVAYMFQRVLGDITIHMTPDLNQIILRVIRRFNVQEI